MKTGFLSNVALSVLFFLIAVPRGFAQKPPTQSAITNQRYQLISAEMMSASDPDKSVPQLFLLDTETGKVWRYVSTAGPIKDFKNGESILTGAFIPVERLDSVLSSPK
jgi:hypothetical protein